MPTYEYECDACGNRFEKFQSMSSPAIKKCPSCGKLKVRRLVGTGAGIIFKGSGFYITDYRSENYKNDQKADGGGKASGDASEKSTSEAPAPAADAKPAGVESKSEPIKPSVDSSSAQSESKTSSVKSPDFKSSSSSKKKKD